MKTLLSAFVLCFTISFGHAQESVATVKREAEKCAHALLTEDYAQVVSYTHARVLSGVGGKDAMIEVLTKGRKQMRDQGFDFIEAKMGSPTVPKKIGTWVIAQVPEELVMKVPGGRLHQNSSLLAISEDDGKHWVFVDLGPLSSAQFAQVFPELDGKVSLPEPKEPVFEKDAKG